MASARTLQRKRSPKPGSPLTAREREVLTMIWDGARTADIARRLRISQATVGCLRRSMFIRLDVGNMVEAVRRGLELGLLSLAKPRA